MKGDKIIKMYFPPKVELVGQQEYNSIFPEIILIKTLLWVHKYAHYCYLCRREEQMDVYWLN